MIAPRLDDRPATVDPAELRRLRLAIEASGEIIFTTDANGTFTYVNPEFQRAYGYDAVEVVGRATPRILKNGATQADEYASFWTALKQNHVVRREFVNKTKNGSLLHIECSANPIVDDAGYVVGFLAVQRDVTERRTLERQLLQSQKMEAVGRLAGGIAHDFNNMLTVILGFSELLQERAHDVPDILADVAEIRKAGDRASHLTRQLLAFSRKQPTIRELVDLNALIADVAKMLGRVLGEDVELSVETAPGVWPIVADRTQIEQVLLNLAVNSRDAMPKGGRLTIATVNAELDEAFARLHGCTVPGSYVSLTIRDTGCGMSPEVLAHAFDPFFTTKPQGKGTGLGLSIVYGIVKQNGGCIIIDSRPNAGTAITILWPRSSDHEEVTRSSSVSSSHDQRGTETILLVEDEPGIRSLMRKALARHGYRVLEANGVWEALAIAAAHDGPIDLLLSDVIMPGLSGPDLAQRIITRRPAIKVLHVSGFPNSLTVNGDLNRRRVSFLAKPFTPQALVLNVRKCLDK